MGVMESTKPETTLAPLPVRISMLSPTTKGREMYCARAHATEHQAPALQ